MIARASGCHSEWQVQRPAAPSGERPEGSRDRGLCGGAQRDETGPQALELKIDFSGEFWNQKETRLTCLAYEIVYRFLAFVLQTGPRNSGNRAGAFNGDVVSLSKIAATHAKT